MMRTIISLAFSLSVLLSSCDPDKKDIFNAQGAKLLVSINNTNESILLGDTIKIHLQVPDSIQTTSGMQVVHSLQRCQFGMTVDRMDTATRIGKLIRPPFIWVTKGTMEGNLSFVSNTNQKLYETIIYCKPQEKGLYFIDIINQPGQLRINNNYEARLFVNFNVPDKHFNILSIIAPYFGGQPIYDAIFQKDLEGFGTYFFRVE